jgi:hypothetical protein
VRQQAPVSYSSALVVAGIREWQAPVAPTTWTLVQVEAVAVGEAAR